MAAIRGSVLTARAHAERRHALPAVLMAAACAGSVPPPGPELGAQERTLRWDDGGGGCPPVTLVPCGPLLLGQDFRDYLPADGSVDTSAERLDFVKRIYAGYKEKHRSPVVWDFDLLVPEPDPYRPFDVVVEQHRRHPSGETYPIEGARVLVQLDPRIRGADAYTETLFLDPEPFDDAVRVGEAEASALAVRAVQAKQCRSCGVRGLDEADCALKKTVYSRPRDGRKGELTYLLSCRPPLDSGLDEPFDATVGAATASVSCWSPVICG